MRNQPHRDYGEGVDSPLPYPLIEKRQSLVSAHQQSWWFTVKTLRERRVLFTPRESLTLFVAVWLKMPPPVGVGFDLWSRTN